MNDATNNPTTTKLRDLISLVDDLDANACDALATGRPRGPVTGLSEIDQAIGGALPEGLIILQGAPGAGKSALGLQIAASCQFPALIVSAEMAPIELFLRLIARHSGQFLRRLKTGELGRGKLTTLASETAKAYPNLTILDATRGGATLERIEAALDPGRALILIDSLHVWALGLTKGAAVTEYDSIGMALTTLAALASHTRSPVVTIAHRNRQGQKGGGLHAAKGHGGIEYAAELVFDLNLKDEAKWGQGAEKDVTLTIEKNRHGAAGEHIELVFTGALQSFRQKHESRPRRGAAK